MALVIALYGRVPPSVALQPTEPGLVRLSATYHESNAFVPWLRDTPRNREGYAVRVAPHLFLTTESLLRNQRAVEVQQPQSGRKFAVRVRQTDPQVNLGLVECAVEDAALGQIVPIAERWPTQTVFEILQCFDSGEIQRLQATPLRAAMMALPEAPFRCLAVMVQTESSVNGRGAPVLCNGRLIGLVMGYDRGSRVATISPLPTLQRFIHDATGSVYRGFASAGVRTAPLVDPVKRAFWGLPPDDRGVLVLSCLPGTGAAQVLRRDDVILSWDGFRVDSQGMYEDPEFGRIEFTFLAQGRRVPGEMAQVVIRRGGTEMTVGVPLDRYRDAAARIPEDVEGEAPAYFVEGGLVLRELTGRYLRGHGADWMRTADTRLVHLYLLHAHEVERPGDRVVVVSAVLPDAINVGYQNVRNQIVVAANGEEIRNLDDVFRIAERDGCLRRLRFQGVGVEIAFDEHQLAEANTRIAAAYRILRLREPGRRAADGI